MILQDLLRNFQEGSEIGDVLWRSLCLAVEDGCGCDFVATDVLGDLFEAEFLGGLGLEEGRGCGGEVGVLRCLLQSLVGTLSVGGWGIFWGLTSSVARDMADNFEVIWLPTYNWAKTYSRGYQFH